MGGKQFFDWAKLLARFVSLEMLVQALGFAGGLLVVRALSKADYALFTLANTMQGTLNVLADNGISSGLTSIGGRVWQDGFRFGQLITTALQLRRVLALMAVTLILPVLVWLLVDNGASFTYASLITAAVLLGAYFQITIGVLMPVPRLHLQVNRLQNLNLGSALLRLLLLCAAYFVLFNAAMAVLAGSLSFALQHLVLRRWVPQLVDTRAPINHEDRREMLAIVKSQAPNSIYYCVQGQITIWLITFFGNTQSIAEIGALGRLGVVFTVVASVLGNVVYPRFARVQSASQLWVRYWQILGVYALFSGVLLGITALFPGQILWLLGSKYAHLRDELFLMVLGSVQFSLLGTMWQINFTRAWILSAWVLIPVALVTQTILVLLLDMSKVHDVLLLNVLFPIPGFFFNFWMTWKGIRQVAAAEARGSTVTEPAGQTGA